MNSDYQRVVEYLRDLRQGALQTVTDEIAQAATDYAELCTKANERLRKCSTFLQQGLRSEAIHLAEENPNLLDLVAALDLPDPQTWSDFCANNGLTVPPPLQLDRASQLNDAYAADQPLEHLLSRHRLLALSRAPVRERLSVMRKLSALDPTSANWEKDIRIFEKARLGELPTEFYAAVKSRDGEGITALMTELSASPWFEPVPADLTTAVSEAYARVQQAAVETELRNLLEPLRDAFAAQSAKECQALVMRWKKIMARAGVNNISQELQDELKPVVMFVAEQERREAMLTKFRNSCKTYAAMLDRDASDAELEAGYARLKEFNEPIPEELTARFADKRDRRQKAAERSHKTRLVGIGISAAAIVVVALVVVWLFMRGHEAESWAQRIRASNADHNLAKAEQDIEYLRKNKPSLLDDPKLAGAVRDTEALLKEQNDLLARLNSNLQTFAAAQRNAAPVEADANATLDQLLTVIVSLQQVIDRANQQGNLSAVDTDGKHAAALNVVQTLAEKLKSRAATAARTEVEQSQAKADSLQTGDLIEATRTLAQIAERMTAIKSAPGMDEDTRTAAVRVLEKVDQQRAALEAKHGIVAALETVKQAKTPDDLAKELAAFVARYPNDPRSAEFTLAIARIPLARGILAWRDVIRDWNGQFPPQTADKAQKRIDAVTAFLAANPDSPIAGPASTYMEYLRHATEALAEKGSWLNTFADITSQPLYSELSVMRTTDNKVFYVLGDIELKNRRLGSQVTTTFVAIDPDNLTKRQLVTIEAPAKLVKETPEKLPHAVAIADIFDDVKSINENNWDTWGIDRIELLRKNKEFQKENEIVVEAILIQQILKTEESLAGWALGDAYSRAINDLARQQLDQVHWWDVEHAGKVSDKTKNALREIIDAIPPGATVRQTLAARKAALFKMLQFDYVATGVLIKDEAGRWTVGAPIDSAINGNILWAIAPGAPAEAPQPATATATAPSAIFVNPTMFVQIGKVVDGKFKVDGAATRNVPQGSIVYVTRP